MRCAIYARVSTNNGTQHTDNQVDELVAWAARLGHGVHRVYCDRITGTTAAYPVAFPVGLLPTNRSDTGLTVQSKSTEAWRADGAMVTQASLGDPSVFTGNGYMLLGLDISAIKGQYSEESAKRAVSFPAAIVLARVTSPTNPSSTSCFAIS